MVLGCLSGCRNDAGAGKFKLDSAAPIKVNVFKPQRVENATQTSSFFGKLKANRSQTLGFPVGGSLATVPQSQQRFASGATIATIDSTQLAEQLEQLEQQVTAAEASGFDNPQNQAQQDQIAELQNQISQRTIKAPFDCIVQSTFAQQNSLVGANRPVVAVVETTTPNIEIVLPRRIVKQIQDTRDYDFLLDGQTIKATLRDRAFTESPPGNVKMVFDIKTNLDNIVFYLNQAVEARFRFPSDQSGCWLPVSCLQQASDGEWFVLAINEDGEQKIIRRQVVKIAQLRDDQVLVTDDLSQQPIVRDGVHRVVPGQQVELNWIEFEAESEELADPEPEPPTETADGPDASQIESEASGLDATP